MRHRLGGLSTYGINGQCLEGELLALAPLGYGPFTYPVVKIPGIKRKVKTKLAGVALVQFGRNCKCSFEGYRIVALDRQMNSLE